MHFCQGRNTPRDQVETATAIELQVREKSQLSHSRNCVQLRRKGLQKILYGEVPELSLPEHSLGCQDGDLQLKSFSPQYFHQLVQAATKHLSLCLQRTSVRVLYGLDVGSGAAAPNGTGAFCEVQSFVRLCCIYCSGTCG